MIANLKINNQNYRVNLQAGTDISLPVTSDESPNCYYAEPFRSEVIRAGDFVGSVDEGGSVNYRRLSLTPHGNGTHSECYGHIAPGFVPITDCFEPALFSARLIDLPVREQAGGDQMLLLSDLEKALENFAEDALIIRTLPNPESKKNRQYSGSNPPYLEPACGELLARKKVLHLLVDLPSLDRESDGGKLAVHRGFWNFPGPIRKSATVTELIFVPDELPAGLYLLDLQIPPIAADAVPSRPVVFPLESV